MTSKKDIYKCKICGNIVEVLHSGVGELVCCGQPMEIQKENSDDSASKEKHVPVIEDEIIKVGSMPHPMEEKHYIEWVEGGNKNDETSKVFLSPGKNPEAKFSLKPVKARAYCNVHGLWSSENLNRSANKK